MPWAFLCRIQLKLNMMDCDLAGTRGRFLKKSSAKTFTQGHGVKHYTVPLCEVSLFTFFEKKVNASSAES